MKKIILCLSLLLMSLYGCNNKGHDSLKIFTKDSKQYIYFGSYPQTIVSDPDIIDAICNIRGTNSNGYIEYEGKEYCKKMVESYNFLPYNFLYSNGKVVEHRSYDYFAVEPLLWRIIDVDDSNNYVLLSEKIVNCHRFDDDSNIYADSEIRTWLNNDFLNQAFDDEEKAIILTTTVNNNAGKIGTTTEECIFDSTDDKVYLLSYYDYQNANYGFDNWSSRMSQFTDYYLACDGIMSSNYNYRYGSYWTRTLRAHYTTAYYVKPDGMLEDLWCDNTVDLSLGVRPALRINLQ